MPLKLSNLEREEELKSLLGLCESISQTANIASMDAALFSEVHAHINRLPLPLSVAVSSKREELDLFGTRIWNLATRSKREANNTSDDEREALVVMHVFSFFLVDTATQNTCNSTGNYIRVLKVSLKAARICLEAEHLSLCLKVMERAAYYEDGLEETIDSSANDWAIFEQLRTEFYFLRIAIAWRQSRLDVAEHMYLKANSLGISLQGDFRGRSLDLLSRIGRDLFRSNQLESAITWLERGKVAIEDGDLYKSSLTLGEMRLTILHNLARSLFKLSTTDSRNMARDLVNILERDFKERLAVILLKIQLLYAESIPDNIQIFDTLTEMASTMTLTDSNFKIYLREVHRLKITRLDLACKSLEKFIRARLLVSDHLKWLEKILITRLYFASCSSEDESLGQILYDLLDEIFRETGLQISPKAAHATQALLWQRVEREFSAHNYENAQQCCRLAYHTVLLNCDPINKSKINRKLMLCSLLREDFTSAREAYFRLSDVARKEPESLYLAYQTALRTKDTQLASESLSAMSTLSLRDTPLLYACILEAQQSGDQKTTLDALLRLLETHDFQPPMDIIHLPSLLRCTIRLLAKEILALENISSTEIRSLCRLFQCVSNQASPSSSRSKKLSVHEFTSVELDWFSRNGYNIILKICVKIPSEDTLRLLTWTIHLTNLLLDDISTTEHDSIQLRQCLCHYIAVCVCVIIARSEEDLNAQRENYISLTEFSQSFRSAAQNLLNGAEMPSQVDLAHKLVEVLTFELEACLKLERWESVDQLFKECWQYPDLRSWKILADLVLLIHDSMKEKGVDTFYRKKAVNALMKMVDIGRKSQVAEAPDLAKWLRCAFEICLGVDISVGLDCIHEAVEVFMTFGADSYPTEELEWLSVTSFNQALDFYRASDDLNYKLWVNESLRMATLLRDEGRLQHILEHNLSKLK